MKKRGIIIMNNTIFLILMITSGIWSFISAEYYPGWTNYTNSEDLVEFTGKYGYLWIATKGAILQIDKKTFELKSFSKTESGIPLEDINSLYEDDNGNIWIGFNKRQLIACFNGKDVQFYSSTDGLSFVSPSLMNCEFSSPLIVF